MDATKIDLTLRPAIRDHLRQERALGSPRFKAMVEKTLNRPTDMRLPGRPAGPSGEGFKR